MKHRLTYKDLLVPGAFSGAVFDLDGTLVDSMDFWENAAAHYLSEQGGNIPATLREDVCSLNVSESAEYFIRVCGIRKTVDTVVTEINRMCEEYYRFTVPAKPGAAEFVRSLSGAGIPLKILTATDQVLASAALERLGMKKFFQEILSCSVGMGKHDPNCFTEAAASFGAVPETILVVEDAFYAIRSAKKAGFTVIAVPDPSAAAYADRIRETADLCLDLSLLTGGQKS